jgi:hypothetical protein
LRLKKDIFYQPDGGNLLMAHCHPDSLTPTFVKQFHEGTHSGQTALETTLAQYFYVPKLSNITKTVCVSATIPSGPRAPPQVPSAGGIPFEDMIVDFTEMPQARGCKYLMVFVCILSG